MGARLQRWFAPDPEARYLAEIAAQKEEQRVRNDDPWPRESVELRRVKADFARDLAIEYMKRTIADLRLKVDARELEILSLRRTR